MWLYNSVQAVDGYWGSEMHEVDDASAIRIARKDDLVVLEREGLEVGVHERAKDLLDASHYAQ